MTKTSSDLINEYRKIEEIVAVNPDITAEDFGEKLKEASINDVNYQYKSNGQELSGYALLHYAISFGNQSSIEYNKIIELLIARNADVNLKTSACCMTPLDFAAIKGNAEVMRMLLGTGEAKEKNKTNALCFATISANLEIINLLLNNGVNVNSLGTNEKMSPLAFAVACPERFAVNENRIQIVQRLLDAGADPLFKNGKNPYTEERDYINTKQCSEKTPLEIAQEQSNQEIVTLLENTINKKKEEQSTSSSSNENVGSRPVAEVAPTNPDNERPVAIVAPTVTNTDDIPVSTTNADTNEQSNHNNENVDNKPIVTTTERNTGDEIKYKKSRKDFYTSLGKDFLGVVVAGLLITTAVMVPSVAGAIVFGALAVLVAIGTGLHIKNSTIPSYNEMKNSRVEPIDPKRLSPQG